VQLGSAYFPFVLILGAAAGIAIAWAMVAVFALTREDQSILEVDVLKNRHGPLVSYSLEYDDPRCAVKDFEK
jgi:hypothetical protein